MEMVAGLPMVVEHIHTSDGRFVAYRDFEEFMMISSGRRLRLCRGGSGCCSSVRAACRREHSGQRPPAAGARKPEVVCRKEQLGSVLNLRLTGSAGHRVRPRPRALPSLALTARAEGRSLRGMWPRIGARTNSG